MKRGDVTRLFVYGTLMPGQPRWPILSPYVARKPTRACVAGVLCDTGRGYPALFPGDRQVPGVLVELTPATAAEALALLDDVEGVGAGLFARELVTCEVAEAWAYVGREEDLRRAPITSWT